MGDSSLNELSGINSWVKKLIRRPRHCLAREPDGEQKKQLVIMFWFAEHLDLDKNFLEGQDIV